MIMTSDPRPSQFSRRDWLRLTSAGVASCCVSGWFDALAKDAAALPNSVSIAPYRFFSPAAHGTGFLGPKYAPLVVGETAPYNGTGTAGTKYNQSLKVKNLDLPSEITSKQRDARVELLGGMQAE